MKKKIIIFGSGAHSKVVFSEIIKLKTYNFLGFVDSLSPKGQKVISYKKKTFFNLGSIEEVIKKKNKYGKFSGIIGIGLNHLRKKIVNDVFKLDKTFKWETIVSKDCILNGNVTIEEGSLIMSGVTINTETVIGKHCIVNTSSSIDHDNKFKNFSSCGPGVITGGNVKLGDSSHLGIGSIVEQGIEIGKNTVVGGNSFVNKKCEDNKLYFGVPIKKIRSRKISENYLK
ncbi:PglD-related sugar-binding protein [Candidatus Pelagibacter sp.]|uniref:PglD-related sugar-binding protein n=1 Tax=Candidatus Pelagibacter sp. TaxID=2024849 RepID=UPI003F8748F3